MKQKISKNRADECWSYIDTLVSGSPILQNGKLIGAVTHVLVDDPTKGYGIFAEICWKQRKVWQRVN